MKPLVVISDPHFYNGQVRVGAHQYADVFARKGWEVLYVTADFFVPRVFCRGQHDSQMHAVWRSSFRTFSISSPRNLQFGHFLPRAIRFAVPARLAAKFYIPSPRRILNQIGRSQADLLWLHGNDDFLHRHAWPHRKLLVRLFDLYEPASKLRQHRMLELLRGADAVFACSEEVRTEYSYARDNINLVPNGVDFEHFAEYSGSCPDWLASVKEPRVIYIGAIAGWFDWDLAILLARSRPEYSFILIGPVSSEPTTTPPSNLHVVGPKKYAELPGIAAHATCGIVPFKTVRLVNGVSPIKVYEYLAAGLPTVSVYWPELERQRLPIALARSAEEFLSMLDAAIKVSREDRNRLVAAVRGCSWANRLEEILRSTGF